MSTQLYLDESAHVIECAVFALASDLQAAISQVKAQTGVDMTAWFLDEVAQADAELEEFREELEECAAAATSLEDYDRRAARIKREHTRRDAARRDQLFITPTVDEIIAAGAFISPPVRRSCESHARRGQRRSAASRRDRAVDRLDPDREPPASQQCRCGCGEALPPGKRAYVDDAHSNRARQRTYRERNRPAVALTAEEAAAERELQRYADRRVATFLEAAGSVGARERLERDVARRQEIWVHELHSANGNRERLRAELADLNLAIEFGWEGVRAVRAVTA